MTVQLAVLLVGLVAVIAIAVALRRAARYAPKPGQWQGDVDDDAARKRWSARSSAGFSDRSGSGGG